MSASPAELLKRAEEELSRARSAAGTEGPIKTICRCDEATSLALKGALLAVGSKLVAPMTRRQLEKSGLPDWYVEGAFELCSKGSMIPACHFMLRAKKEEGALTSLDTSKAISAAEALIQLSKRLLTE